MKNCFAFNGKNGIIIFDPSSGGKGIRLNNPNPKFMVIIDINICNTIIIGSPT